MQNRALQEMCRRFSLGFSVIVFTLVGIAFGIELSRERKVKRLLWAVGLMTFFLVCFIAGKSMRYHTLFSILFFLLPHILILFACIRAFKQVARGSE